MIKTSGVWSVKLDPNSSGRDKQDAATEPEAATFTYSHFTPEMGRIATTLF